MLYLGSKTLHLLLALHRPPSPGPCPLLSPTSTVVPGWAPSGKPSLTPHGGLLGLHCSFISLYQYLKSTSNHNSNGSVFWGTQHRPDAMMFNLWSTCFGRGRPQSLLSYKWGDRGTKQFKSLV